MTKKKQKNQYYSLNDILKKNADYSIIFGERSNGKTYASLLYGLKHYLKTGEQMAYVRRWKEDLRGHRASTLFAGLVANGEIIRLTKGEYNEVFYYSGKWFLSYYDAETKKRTPSIEPLCFAFALSDVEHDKSTSYPNVSTIIFDEFITRRYYLPDEFIIFMNVLSTIIRDRDGVRVLMLGNTVNKFCPYFAEMGLTNIQSMEIGTIDIYKFGKKGATVAVEYTAPTAVKKASNKYFSFDNEQLEMITGGKWELSAYPHLPIKYRPKDVLFNFFIDFNGQLLEGKIIQVENMQFIFIHRKTTPLIDGVLTYSLTPNPKPYYRRQILSHATTIQKRIASFFIRDLVFFQDNEVGDVVRNYILESKKNNVFKV